MGDLARASLHRQQDLYRVFGVNAEILIDHAWGLEPCGMKEILSVAVRIRYFKGDEVGYYKKISGVIERIATVNQELQIMADEKKDWGKVLPVVIAFDDIVEIKGEWIVHP